MPDQHHSPACAASRAAGKHTRADFVSHGNGLVQAVLTCTGINDAGGNDTANDNLPSYNLATVGATDDLLDAGIRHKF